MNETNKIIQTFWTKPMNKSHLYLTMKMMYASAKSIKKQGYDLVLYTDALGSKIVKGFPYDDVVVLDIPDKVNPEMFAAIKYFALRNEELGTIHLDYDIIIDKPCICPKDGWDVLVQMRHDEIVRYSKERKILIENGTPSRMREIDLSMHPYCVGVIGFNNESLKKEFIDNYFEAIDIYSNKNIRCTIDFLLEQSFLPSLVDKYGYRSDFVAEQKATNYKYPTDDKNIRYFCDEQIGFAHFHSKSKWTIPVINKISNMLTKDDNVLINENYKSAISLI